MVIHCTDLLENKPVVDAALRIAFGGLSAVYLIGLLPLLLINPYSRKVSLLIGVLFHFGLLLTMNLRWFPVIKLSLYPALLSNSRFIRLEEELRNLHEVT